MRYNSVSEIYEAIDKIRNLLKEKVSGLSDEQANLRENDAGWTVAEIVEHLAILEHGVIQIAGKLAAKAEREGGKFNGIFNPPFSFAEKAATLGNEKLAAPERIHPQGGITIAESLVKLDENRRVLNELRPRIEAADSSDAKFPHPFFGDLNLYEWLVIVGLHERRHLQQIERILN